MRLISKNITRIADNISNPHETEWVSKQEYPRPPREWGSDYHETELGWGRGVKNDESKGMLQTFKQRFMEGEHRAPMQFLDYLMREPIGEGRVSYSSLMIKQKKQYEEIGSLIEKRLDAKSVARNIKSLQGELEMGLTTLPEIAGKPLKSLIKDCDDETIINHSRDLEIKREEFIKTYDEAHAKWMSVIDEREKTCELMNRKGVMAKNLFHQCLKIRPVAAPDPALGYPLNEQGNELRQRVMEGIAWAGSIIDWKKTDSPINIGPCDKETLRAKYVARTATIQLSPASDDGTYIHELGHHLELQNISVMGIARNFYESRTKFSKIVKMKELDPYGNYADDEYGRDDAFISKYTGKYYESGATEIISMGLEHMYRDPIEFKLKDPEHFDVIMKVLRLLKHDSEK